MWCGCQHCVEGNQRSPGYQFGDKREDHERDPGIRVCSKRQREKSEKGGRQGDRSAGEGDREPVLYRHDHGDRAGVQETALLDGAVPRRGGRERGGRGTEGRQGKTSARDHISGRPVLPLGGKAEEAHRAVCVQHGGVDP